ncbi:hypothetical protein BLNAU_21517 [Blattamonas nauphoetae]|uniref:Uncharacterized protein n=1 Tax=Blattamonas nauphoetae TaxID=2049346 RepID=A0ABQ9WYU2_9EUKA|nr:hypothetical protein BLNAU_21517 [Blattamonas nauphoetae]
MSLIRYCILQGEVWFSHQLVRNWVGGRTIFVERGYTPTQTNHAFVASFNRIIQKSRSSLKTTSHSDGGLLLTYHSPNRAAFSRSSSKFMTCSARFGGIDLLSNGPASVCHMLFVDCCRPHSEDEVSDPIRLADCSGREGLRVPEHGVLVVDILDGSISPNDDSRHPFPRLHIFDFPELGTQPALTTVNLDGWDGLKFGTEWNVVSPPIDFSRHSTRNQQRWFGTEPSFESDGRQCRNWSNQHRNRSFCPTVLCKCRKKFSAFSIYLNKETTPIQITFVGLNCPSSERCVVPLNNVLILPITFTTTPDTSNPDYIRYTLSGFAIPSPISFTTPPAPARLESVGIVSLNKEKTEGIVPLIGVTLSNKPFSVVIKRGLARISPIITLARLSPIITLARLSPIISLARISPIITLARISPIITLARISPIITLARISPIISLARISPIITLARISPIITLARISPIITLARLSPIISLARLSPIISLARISPIITLARK